MEVSESLVFADLSDEDSGIDRIVGNVFFGGNEVVVKHFEFDLVYEIGEKSDLFLVLVSD